MIPGSSGSPVALKPLTTRYVRENIQIQSSTLLLGIIAETRYAPVRTPTFETLSFAGLGLAFDTETIIETIDLFDKN